MVAVVVMIDFPDIAAGTVAGIADYVAVDNVGSEDVDNFDSETADAVGSETVDIVDSEIVDIVDSEGSIGPRRAMCNV